MGKTWTFFKNFSKRINTKFHESTSVFTKDGNTMYFTRNDFSGGKLGVDRTRTTRLKIYKSVKSGKKWGRPKELPFNSRNYSVAHPTLSPDETTLYFTSDMPGTLGASDLWVVDIFENGSFSKPRNLGPSINTESKETFPFVSSSNNLYFASDGHVGLGGLDIFVSKINDDSSFGEVINVGKPINGPTDDFTFIVDEEDRTGYFASNRKGGKGSDDIYIFRLRPNEIKKLEQLVMGLVTDAEFIAMRDAINPSARVFTLVPFAAIELALATYGRSPRAEALADALGLVGGITADIMIDNNGLMRGAT